MGIYINPGNEAFRVKRNGKYVDKSGLIGVVNRSIGQPNKLSCISRPRRFGKSYAAQMLCAYYSFGCDSAPLFDDLEIAKDETYREHLNKYNVLYIDISEFNGTQKPGGMLDAITRSVSAEVYEQYTNVKPADSLGQLFTKVVETSGRQFVAIIDEWDAPIRDKDCTAKMQKTYLEFLRSLFKNSAITDKVFAAAYMTGILPIKKDGSQSAISEFWEYTILSPGPFAPYVGFTKDEVRTICDEFHVSLDEMKYWYDGYTLKNVGSTYNPNSVMKAAYTGEFKSYWPASSDPTSLLEYLNLDKEGLGKTLIKLMTGNEVPLNSRRFRNDPSSLNSEDDVLTLLTHYGYLSYDEERETVRIPNEEIRIEYADSIHDVTHVETIQRVRRSVQLMKDTADMRADAVAAELQRVHTEEYSPRHYNNEQSLRGTIKLAYFAYRDEYIQMEELAGGTGYADIVYLPKRNSDYPALVIELKVLDKKHPERDSEGAIAQIKKNNYPASIQNYTDEILLVGISYDKDDPEKKHTCIIESLGSEDL
ncbi:MAG: AAA family ATPase [Proteobacteria bacterium]|nr:AAA family ATPase [Pseudomonadota bacterium]